jgi:hypothetical protein
MVSAMENGAESKPDAQGDPFRSRKVSRDNGQDFHQEKQQRDNDPQACHDTHRNPLLHQPKRQTSLNLFLVCGAAENSNGQRELGTFSKNMV